MKTQLRFIFVLILINLAVAMFFFQLETLRSLKDAEIYQNAAQIRLPEFGIAYVKFLGFMLLLSTISISILIYVWFVNPLSMIIKAMSQKDASSLGPLMKKTNEFARLARLTANSFEDKQKLEREIRLRDIAEESLQLRERQLKELISKRDRLLRDLHDETIQKLFALGLRIESSFQATSKHSTEQRREFQKLVNDVIQSLRNHLEDPHSKIYSSQFNFRKNIQSLANTLEKVSTCRFEIKIEEELNLALTQHQGHEITALATEVFSNAIRHGAPSLIIFEAYTSSAKSITIKIIDNGLGCNIKTIKYGKGINNMKARTDELSGTFQIQSSPGQGFTTEIQIPSQNDDKTTASD